MQEQPINRHWQTIEIPAKEFSDRLSQLSATHASTGSLFSRLALIHEVAKAYAAEALTGSDSSFMDLEIEEITDPPLYGSLPDDEPILIQFSYPVHT